MWRGALVGLGNVAVHGHVPGWLTRDDVAIVAVTDARASRRVVSEATLPGARWYESPDELLAQAELDFVDICTPPSSHVPIAEAALKRGLHVLCEKPLARSPAEVEALAALARESSRALYTVHNWHEAPMVRIATDLIRSGEIGPVAHIEWETLRTAPAAAADAQADNWRLDPAVAGGGVLSDHGWHVSYVVQRWVGARPAAVTGRLETRRHTRWPVEDTARLSIAFPDATADIHLTWAADERANRVRIEGRSGRIELREDALVLTARGTERRSVCPPLSSGSQHPDWFGGVIDGFVAEMNGSALRGDNLEEAMLCATIEHLARESSRRGGERIPIPPRSLLASRPAPGAAVAPAGHR